MKKIPLVISPDYTTFFAVPRMYSYKGVNVYIIIGGRGIGKTTGFGVQCICNYNKRGEEFAYMRRYITELKKTKGLFDPIAKGVTVKGLSHGAYQFMANKKRIGYGLALTAQQTFKSGMDFSKVTTLIFDECILPRGGAYRYLENEIEMVLELISTVFRTRKNYKVFLLGNNADIFNPYWEYFNIPNFEKNYIDKERGLYCEKAKNSAKLLEIEMDTPLYKLTKGTAYWDYHYNNEVLTKNKHVRIIPKPMKCTLLCRSVLNGFTLNIYRHKLDRIYIEYRDKIIKDEYSYMIMEDGVLNIYYGNLYKKSDAKKFIDAMYYGDGDDYDSQKSKALMDVLMDTL